MRDILKCYVAGRKFDKNAGGGVISFAVPEYGIMFRCGMEGTITDLNIIAFLTFLRFAEHNREVFQKRELHIYSDFPLLVYLMNEGPVPGKGMDAVKRQAQKYARGFIFKVKWISHQNNRAAGPTNSIPVVPVKSNIKIKSFIDINPKNKPDKPEDIFPEK